MKETVLKPSIDGLTELLSSYGHPEIRVPSIAMRVGNRIPWVAYVNLIFDDQPSAELVTPNEWRKKIIDRIEAMTEAMRSVGWVLTGGIRLVFDSEFEPPTCTLGQKLVKPGHEYGITAHTEFEVVPINGGTD